MRLPALPFARLLVGLTLAIASPGVDVAHGMAHEHVHDRAHQASPVTAGDAAAPSARHSHPEDHPHANVSEALRGTRPAADYLVLPAGTAAPQAAIVVEPESSPVSEPRLAGDRPTGPPPRLRDPPRI